MILHNAADVPVIDFPIQDPTTGDVAMWSLRPGDTKDFPEYVGTTLLGIYGFIQRYVTQEELDRENAAIAKVRNNQQFTQIKVINKTQAGGYTNKLLQDAPDLSTANPPVVPTTTENQQVAEAARTGDPLPVNQTTIVSEPPANVPVAAPGSTCPLPGCGMQFEDKIQMRVHYAQTHPELLT